MVHFEKKMQFRHERHGAVSAGVVIAFLDVSTKTCCHQGLTARFQEGAVQLLRDPTDPGHEVGGTVHIARGICPDWQPCGLTQLLPASWLADDVRRELSDWRSGVHTKV